MKHAIIKDKLPVYLKATKNEKGVLLRDLMSVTGMPSKSLIRALAREQLRSTKNPPKKRGRKKYYTNETEAALAYIWEQCNPVAK